MFQHLDRSQGGRRHCAGVHRSDRSFESAEGRLYTPLAINLSNTPLASSLQQLAILALTRNIGDIAERLTDLVKAA